MKNFGYDRTRIYLGFFNPGSWVYSILNDFEIIIVDRWNLVLFFSL